MKIPWFFNLNNLLRTAAYTHRKAA